MRNRRFQNKVTAGRFTLPAAMLIATVCWTAAALLLPDTGLGDAGPQWLQSLAARPAGHWFLPLAGFLLHSAVAFFLVNLNNAFALIRVRASIQSAIYFLLIAALPAVHEALAGLLCSVCCLIALQLLFSGYRQEQTSGTLFHCFALAGIAGMIVPPYMLLVPLLWTGAFSFFALNLRSMAASVVGFAFPWWMAVGYATLTGHTADFLQYIGDIRLFRPLWTGFDLLQSVSLAFLFVVYAVSAVHCLLAGYEDKIRTRTYLYFLVFFGFCQFVLVALQPYLFASFCPLLVCTTSILAGHLFALTGSRLSNAFFIFTLAGTLFLYFYQLWTLL